MHSFGRRSLSGEPFDMNTLRKTKSISKAKNNKKPDQAQKASAFHSVKERILSQNPAFYFWSALLLFTLPISLAKLYDTDIWWHMQLGRSMLENMGLPNFEKFYFSPVTNDYGDLRFTWLGDIFLYCVHWLGGDFGLQMLRLCIVVLSCYLFKTVAGSRYNGWQLLMLMLFVVGTYQKQLVRNSLFSLIFTSVLFWIWYRLRYEDKEKLLWTIPPLIGVWGCMHGSYLLGFGLTGLLFLGDWIDSLRGLNAGKKKFVLQYSAVIAVSFALISAWNPLTSQFFSIQAIKNYISYDTVIESSKPVAQSWEGNDQACKSAFESPSEDETWRTQFPHPSISAAGVQAQGFVEFLRKIKVALNNTIFKQDNSLLKSADFTSPFDRLDRLYVKTSLLLGVAGLVLLLFFSRPVRFSHVLPFGAIFFFGLGYLRMTGYIPTLATAMIFMAARNSELTLRLGDRPVKVVCAVALIAMYANLASGYKVPVGTELHAFGIGRIPTFSKDTADKVLHDYKDKKALTTIMNGGFLLYNWYPHKKVFLDGFFAPHPYRVFDDYTNLLQGVMDPDELVGKYGIEIAIVEQNKASLNNTFLYAPNWYVRYIDKGNLIHFFEPDYNSPEIPAPAIISDQETLVGLPSVYRKRFAKYLLLIQDSLVKKGRLKDADDFKKQHAELFRRLDHLMAPAEVNYVESAITRYAASYGLVNSKTIAYEMMHFKAAEEGKIEDAEKYGRMVLEKAPDRFPVLFNMAAIYAAHREVEKSMGYLKKLKTAQKLDRAFWVNNRFNLAKLCLNLFYLEKKEGRRVSAYELLREAHAVDDSVISKEKLYEEGIKLVREENEKEHAAVAYEIFKRMAVDFPENGRLYNEMAWHILTHRDRVFEDLETAEKYARKAARLMEKNQDPTLDTAYDTLAETYYQLKEFDKMLEYEKNALKVAPPKRKGLYKHRLDNKDNG